MGVTVFVSYIKRVENYPDFDKLAHVIQHGLQGFIVKNIEGEFTEANDLSVILQKWVCNFLRLSAEKLAVICLKLY